MFVQCTVHTSSTFFSLQRNISPKNSICYYPIWVGGGANQFLGGWKKLLYFNS